MLSKFWDPRTARVLFTALIFGVALAFLHGARETLTLFVIVGRVTLLMAVAGLPVPLGNSLGVVSANSGLDVGCGSGAAPGQIGTWVWPAVGRQTGFCANCAWQRTRKNRPATTCFIISHAERFTNSMRSLATRHSSKPDASAPWFSSGEDQQSCHLVPVGFHISSVLTY